MAKKTLISEKRALGFLMDCLGVEGVSRQEGQIAKLVRQKLIANGCKAGWIRHDKASERIGGSWEVGNLIVKLPGTVKGPRRLLMGHLDTVPLCRGAQPVRRGNRIVSAADTGVGADNRTAVACIITTLDAIIRHRLPHPPITALFTVGEEIGLCGARHVHASDLGNPKMGFNIDGGDPSRVIIGATGADRWHAEVIGLSSHAGVHPEDGISATLIASRAIADVATQGYFGKIKKGRDRGTSNVGMIQGGEASNQVTDRVEVRGETRSHDRKFLSKITSVYRKAFEKAARSVKNQKGKVGRVRFKAQTDYRAFRLDRSEPIVRFTSRTVKSLGRKPELYVVDGGLDANYLYEKRVPTVTLGAGQHSAHTVKEYADVREFTAGCELLLALATGEVDS